MPKVAVDAIVVAAAVVFGRAFAAAPVTGSRGDAALRPGPRGRAGPALAEPLLRVARRRLAKRRVAEAERCRRGGDRISAPSGGGTERGVGGLQKSARGRGERRREWRALRARRGGACPIAFVCVCGSVAIRPQLRKPSPRLRAIFGVSARMPVVVGCGSLEAWLRDPGALPATFAGLYLRGGAAGYSRAGGAHVLRSLAPRSRLRELRCDGLGRCAS